MKLLQKATDELARLRADLARFTGDGLLDCHAICDQRDAAVAERDRLRTEVERLKKQIRDDNRAYGCELRDPNGTIWEQAAKDHARAERAEAELAASRERVRVLREALENLRDEQNGAPLCTRETEWKAAMDKADAALAAIDAAMKP